MIRTAAAFFLGVGLVLPGAIPGRQPPATSDDRADRTAARAEARSEATVAVLKEQVDRLRDDVRGAGAHLQSIQARFDALSQTYYPRAEAEQVRKLDATPERVASLSARVDALEGRVNSFGDKLIGYALAGGLGVAGGGAIYHFSRKGAGNGPALPALPRGYAYESRRTEAVVPPPTPERPVGPPSPAP